MAKLEEYLQGARYHRDDTERLLEPIEIESYFGKLPKEAFVELIFGSDK